MHSRRTERPLKHIFISFPKVISCWEPSAPLHQPSAVGSLQDASPFQLRLYTQVNLSLTHAGFVKHLKSRSCEDQPLPPTPMNNNVCWNKHKGHRSEHLPRHESIQVPEFFILFPSLCAHMPFSCSSFKALLQTFLPFKPQTGLLNILTGMFRRGRLFLSGQEKPHTIQTQQYMFACNPKSSLRTNPKALASALSSHGI